MRSRTSVLTLPLMALVGTLASAQATPASTPGPSANPLAPDGIIPVTATTTTSSNRAVSGYTDRNAWATAAGGTIMTIPFESFADGTAIDGNMAALGISDVSGNSSFGVPQQYVTASGSLPFPMFVAGTLPTEPNFISNDLAAPFYGTGEMTFVFANYTTATGAFVADQAPLDGFSIEVYDGATSLGVITVPPRTLPSSFVGITSTVPFNRARYVAVSDVDSWGLDNFEFFACSNSASANFRNGGTNPASYAAIPPVLGAAWTATVDLTTTGHNFALVVGYSFPTSFALSGGQTLLVDITSPPELLAFSAQGGPFATWSQTVPFDTSLCGVRLSTQAVHFGGVTPFALSNAYDLEIGGN